jgi:UDP-N-acetylmuramate dehydrogenase
MPNRADLLKDLDVDCTPDAAIGPLTWYGVGGRADLMVSPHSLDAVTQLTRRCRLQEIPVRVLGGGANLLVDDDGVDGVVLRLDHECFRTIDYNRRGSVTAARIGGGVDLFGLVTELARRALTGFEHMAGIPGTLGGAIRMNAGGQAGDVGEALERVDCITLDGERCSFAAADLNFRYRANDLPEGFITSAVLTLHEDDPVAVRDRVKTIFAAKKASQPMADHSAGCAFKNPIDPSTGKRTSAGLLIDASSLKGQAVGGARVSERHANFIVMQHYGSASDVLKLMDQIQHRVHEDTGIRLEREVVVWSRGRTS